MEQGTPIDPVQGLSRRPEWLVALLLVWPLYLNELYLIPLSRLGSLRLLWGLDLLVYCAIPVVTLLWIFRSGQLSRQELGIASPGWHTDPAGLKRFAVDLAGALVICALPVWVLENQLWPVLKTTTFNQPPWKLFDGYEFPGREPWHTFSIIYAALTAGVLEEVIYRGAITSLLRRHIRGFWALVAASSAVFAGIHWGEGPARLLYTFIWGILPTIWFLKRGNLWAPILAHTVYDYLSFNELI